MLSKHKYPHLNREQRRHPEKGEHKIARDGSANWLLMGLMIHGGWMPKWYKDAAEGRREREGFKFPSVAAWPRKAGSTIWGKLKALAGRAA